MNGVRLQVLAGFASFLLAAQLQAQYSITGTILDDARNPVPFANVLMLLPADTSLVRGALTDDAGNFLLEINTPGTYLVRATMVGRKDVYAGPFVLSQTRPLADAGTLVLSEDAVLMNEVQVVAERAMFEQQVDRTVVNVAGVATAAGITALEVLERSPGILVNRQSNSISMSGKEGVVVMINGRLNYMPMDAVFQMLSGMGSDNIDKIELITTPPARYDAEGNAGYINIVMKKNPNEGWSGSYNLTVGAGKGFRGQGGINTSYVKGKWAMTADYNYLYNNIDQWMSFFRRIRLDGDLLETDTYNDRQPVRRNHNVRLGLDYKISRQGTLGVQLAAYDNLWTMDAFNTSRLTRNGIPDTLIQTDMDEVNHWKHLGGTLRYDHSFANGMTLSAETSYLWYTDSNPTNYDNAFRSGAGEFLFSRQTRAGKETPIHVNVDQVDLTGKAGERARWEAGVKATFSSFTNDISVDQNNGSGWVSEEDLTAVYELQERILAAYASVEYKFGPKTSAKAGLRYEHTDSNLGSEEDPGIVDRTFGALFPTIYVSHSFSDKYTASISYSRRITRPTFNDMAPFLLFVDPYTYYIGNPALQPALANNIDLNFRLNRLQVGLSFNQADSAIARYQSVIIPGTNQQAWSSLNLVWSRTYSASFGLPVDAGKKWRMYYSIQGSLNSARIVFEGDPADFQAASLNCFSTQSFKLPADFLLELSGSLNVGGLWGINTGRTVAVANIALQKKFGQSGGTLRLGYDDIFNSQIWGSSTEIEELEQFYSAKFRFTQPGVKLTYSRSFGNQKAKVNRRASAADEERKRVE